MYNQIKPELFKNAKLRSLSIKALCRRVGKRLMMVGVAAILALVIAGCTKIPQLVLFNNTPAEVGILWGDKIIGIKSHTRHALPNKPAFDSHSKEFDAIIILNQKRFGYSFDPNIFAKIKPRRSMGSKIKYYLVLNEDGSISLADQKGDVDVSLPEQPQGFPIKPVLVD